MTNPEEVIRKNHSWLRNTCMSMLFYQHHDTYFDLPFTENGSKFFQFCKQELCKTALSVIINIKILELDQQIDQSMTLKTTLKWCQRQGKIGKIVNN